MDKCYNCLCLKSPYCSVNGYYCYNCLNKDLSHKSPDPNKPGYFINDLQSYKSLKFNNNKFLINNNFKVIKTDKNEDSLYNAISIAFDNKITIDDIRYIVGDNQTEEIYQFYKNLALAEEKYKFMKNINSLDEFKLFIKRTGRDYTSNNCIFADENALNIISNKLKVKILILNNDKQITNIILPKSKYLLGCIYLCLDEKCNLPYYKLLIINNQKIIN